MNVDLIKMDPAEAREQLREYRAELHRRADAEYQAVAAGLEALAQGTPILNLTDAIRGGGFDEKMRPRLAVARADRKQVRFRWGGHTTSGEFDSSAGTAHQGAGLVLPMDFGRRHGWRHPEGWTATVEGYALVPMIPAKARRESGVRPTSDRRHFILFEVEEWSDTRLQARPDRDPFLLRHLGGDAYAVLAAWDLTPLEQMVMAGRRNAN